MFIVIKVKLSLGLTVYAPHHEDIKENGGRAYISTILDLGSKWEWSVLHHCHFAPRETAAGTDCLKGSVGAKASLDVMRKRKLFLLPAMKPQSLHCPVHSLVTILTELSQLHVHCYYTLKEN
jgi:hypothetical protein